ncbi:MAG: HD domain-containing protein [Pirellulales bacterium]|nr:HD domain-containing protein [Pirellulales bacterium]
MSPSDRLARQLQFLVEIDKLKSVLRRTWLVDGSRLENDAEHSWHLGLFAVLLAEHAAGENLDLLRVLKMVLMHDLVEIDAGDTYAYDEVAKADQADREQQAADRLFALLPPDQAAEFRGLWDEFEAGRTLEARFAAAVDRFQPLLHNYLTRGRAWRQHGVTSDRVVARTRSIADGAPVLWEHVLELIRDAVAEGYLAE